MKKTSKKAIQKGNIIIKIYNIYNTTTNQNTSKKSIGTANELAGIESLTDHN